MIKKITSKKGSHVGVVVSFVIFVTFLVFLYTIFQPVTVREKDKSYILDYISLNLIGNSSSEVTTVTVDVSNTGDKECINLQNIGEDIIPIELRDNLIIKNSSLETLELEYELQGQGIEVQTGKYYEGFLKIYYSENFEVTQSSLGGCDPHSDPIGLIKSYSEIFESKLNELNESYYTDYKGLKSELGIPEGAEFNFYIYDSQRSKPPIISAKMQEPPTDRSVFVQETPIQYVDEEGNILFGFLVVEIW